LKSLYLKSAGRRKKTEVVVSKVRRQADFFEVIVSKVRRQADFFFEVIVSKVRRQADIFFLKSLYLKSAGRRKKLKSLYLKSAGRRIFF